MKLLLSILVLCTSLQAQSKSDCSGIDKIKHPDERALCEKMQSRLQAESITIQSQSKCEEVTEQYAICNGAKYLRDSRNTDTLKRDTKKIEEYIDSGKLNSGANAVSK